jgi:hypothetical protein
MPATDQKTAAEPAVMTIGGCVQKESAVLKRNPALGNIGMDDEFVLTFSELNPGKETAKQRAAEATPVGSFGKVFRVSGDKERDLKNYVGQRVEITGSMKNKEYTVDKMSSVGTSGTTELTPANTPEITIATVTPISGSCTSGR